MAKSKVTLADYVFAAVIVEATRRQYVEDEYLTLDDFADSLQEMLDVIVSPNEMRASISMMDDADLVLVIRDEFADWFYRLDMPAIIEFYKKENSQQSSLIYKYGAVGSKFLERAMAALQVTEMETDASVKDVAVEVPASDRVVLLTDNSDLRDEIIGRLDDLAEEVRRTNDVDDILGDQKLRIVSEIEAGSHLLKAPSVRVLAVRTVLVSVLLFIAKEFAGGAVGQLAADLLEMLKSILGI